MECLSQEPVLFEDVLCQMHDMVQPAAEGVFTMQDLKRQKGLAGILFNILFNLNKFIAFETRDPFVVRQVCNPSKIAMLLVLSLPLKQQEQVEETVLTTCKEEVGLPAGTRGCVAHGLGSLRTGRICPPGDGGGG